MLIRNPLVWLCRIRHRCGYGIHSPFAFALVTQVLYSPGEYYAYRWLDKLHPWHVRLLRLRPLVVDRLLFRLANHRQPRVIVAPQHSPVEWNFLHEGCRRATIDPGIPEVEADMLVLKANVPGWEACIGEKTLMVVTRLQDNKPLWKRVKTDPRIRVTFDLYDVGLAYFDPKLQRQDYVINW